MAGSSARTLPAAALALAALVVVSAPACAQTERTDAPVTLAPPAPLAPAPAGPPAASEPGAAPEPAPEDQSGGTGISVDTLGEIDPNSVGLLDEGNGGLGIDMWRGTPYGLVKHVLRHLPAPVRSLVMRGLARRLVLSSAKPPARRKGDAATSGGAKAGSKAGPSLLALRADWLLAAGDVGAALGLLKAAPQRIDDPAVLKARIDAALLTDDNSGACDRVRDGSGETLGLLWRKALVFCQLLAGDRDTANIGAALLSEQNVDDPAFFAMARILSGDKDVEVPLPAVPTALHMAMMRAARVRIGPEILERASPAVLRAVAFSPNAGIDTRLEAAERSEAIGALGTDALSDLYGAVNFPPDDVAKALSVAENLPGPRGRALLFHAARLQQVPAARAEILAKAFELARRDGRFLAIARVFLPLLGDVPPRDDLAWFAPDAGAVLYVAGRFDEAGKWLAVARNHHDAGTGEGDATKTAAETPTGTSDPNPAEVAASSAQTIPGPPPRPADVALWTLATLAAVPARERAADLSGEAEAGPGGNGAPPGAVATPAGTAGPGTPTGGTPAGGQAAAPAPAPATPAPATSATATSATVTPAGAAPPAGGAAVLVEPIGPTGPATPTGPVPTGAPKAPVAAGAGRGVVAPAPAIPFERVRFARWWKAERGDGTRKAARARRAELLLALLDGMGIAVPADIWVRTVGDAPKPPKAMPPVGVVRAMAEAAAAGRTAETLLLAVDAMGNGAPAAIDPRTIGSVIGALRKAGFAVDARALALEVAFAARL